MEPFYGQNEDKKRVEEKKEKKMPTNMLYVKDDDFDGPLFAKVDQTLFLKVNHVLEEPVCQRHQ